MVSFGNPLGFLALLALPAIFAIHFLQRESRRVVTSTLFLLEQLAPESAQGRRFERLRNSAPLWLQIIAALLVTWLLVQPRWLLRQSTHRVVIVLDSSISMLPFHDELLRAVDAQTAQLSRAAARTEWHLLESDTTRPKLYSGIDRAALLRASARMEAAPRDARLLARASARATTSTRQRHDDFHERPEVRFARGSEASRSGKGTRELRLRRR